MKVLVLPLFFLFGMAFVLFVTGHKDAAWVVTYPGTGLVSLIAFLYAGLVSKRHWPKASFATRLLRHIRFQY